MATINNDNNYINALNLIIQDIKKNINPAIVNNFLKTFSADGPHPGVFSFQDNKIASIEQGTDESLKIFVWQLLTGLSDEEEQKVIALIKKAFSLSGIKSDQLFFENSSNISQKDSDLIKDDLPTESDMDDAFDKLLDWPE